MGHPHLGTQISISGVLIFTHMSAFAWLFASLFCNYISVLGQRFLVALDT